MVNVVLDTHQFMVTVVRKAARDVHDVTALTHGVVLKRHREILSVKLHRYLSVFYGVVR